MFYASLGIRKGRVRKMRQARRKTSEERRDYNTAKFGISRDDKSKSLHDTLKMR